MQELVDPEGAAKAIEDALAERFGETFAVDPKLQGLNELARIAGHWTEVIRNEICLFRPDKPCDYHFHDGDEYWMVFRGHFTLDYDGNKYDMRPGLMMAAGMGFEHGSVNPEEHFEAVVMAMQLEGQKRDGHLNREMHGAPVKNREVPDSAMQPFHQAERQAASASA